MTVGAKCGPSNCLIAAIENGCNHDADINHVRSSAKLVELLIECGQQIDHQRTAKSRLGSALFIPDNAELKS